MLGMSTSSSISPSISAEISGWILSLKRDFEAASLLLLEAAEDGLDGR